MPITLPKHPKVKFGIPIDYNQIVNTPEAQAERQRMIEMLDEIDLNQREALADLFRRSPEDRVLHPRRRPHRPKSQY